MKTFKNNNEDLQYLIQDYMKLRKYNNLQKKNKTLDDCMLFAEGAVLCVAFERFLRIVPAMKAKESDYLYNLLERAFVQKNPIFKPVHTAEPKELIKVINDFRNGFLHGNFEQISKLYIDLGKISKQREYFSKGFFTSDLEMIAKVFDLMIIQVDQKNGNIL